MELLNFLLVVAAIGAIAGILGKLLNGLGNIVTTILSLFVFGIIYGIVLMGIMILARFLGFTENIEIFDCHPFWIGFVPAVIHEIYLVIRERV